MRFRWPWQDNPILKHEFAARLRGWDAAILHALFVGCCCAAVLVFWPGWSSDPLQAAARAQQIRAALIVVQYVLSALVVAVIAAPLVAREKEQGTYVLLITTPLRPGALVFGKFAVAVGYVLLLELAVLPMLFALTLLGGIEWRDVMADVALLLSAALLFASLQFLASLYQRRTVAALVVGLAVVLAVSSLLLLPVLWRLDQLGAATRPMLRRIGMLTAPAFGVLAIVSTVSVVRIARQRVLHPEDADFAPPPEPDEPPASPWTLVLDRERFPDRLLVPERRSVPIPDDVNPVYDRELRAELFAQGTSMLRAIIQVGTFVSIPLMAITLQMALRFAFIYPWFLLGFLMLVAPAFCGGAVAGELERRTFELLRCTLLRPTQVLIGKVRVSLRTLVGLLLVLTVVQIGMPLLLVWLPLRERVVPLLAAVLVVYGHVPVVVVLSYFWSVVVQKASWANLAAYGTVVAVYGLAELAQYVPVVGSRGPLIGPYRLIGVLLHHERLATWEAVLWATATHLLAWWCVALVGGLVVAYLFRRRWFSH